ncbi:hypothetical protein JTB14_029934 [Gonioctena quinquepunctata]|nr:hypothetical protein JTB14_029934 [Gonioctena quinquepunctata]
MVALFATGVKPVDFPIKTYRSLPCGHSSPHFLKSHHVRSIPDIDTETLTSDVSVYIEITKTNLQISDMNSEALVTFGRATATVRNLQRIRWVTNICTRCRPFDEQTWRALTEIKLVNPERSFRPSK